MDRIDRLITRINKNLSDFHEQIINSFGKKEIIDMAGRIKAMNDAHFYLTHHHAFDYEQADYLLKFRSPLEIVADKWEARISDISDISFDLDKILYDRDAENKGYRLAGPEADAPAVAGAGKLHNEPANADRSQPQPVDVKAEAERVIAVIKGLAGPNSPNKTHYAVKVSHEFMQNARNNDTSKLLRALPFKNASLGGLNGEKGVFVTVPKASVEKSSLLGKLKNPPGKGAAQNRKPGKGKDKKEECL